jgi:hypothetical protein
MSLRHRILKSILKSPLTAEEIAIDSGDTRQRIISNIGSMASDGLIKRISGVTGTVEYQITEPGKVYYKRNLPNTVLTPLPNKAAPRVEVAAPIAETPAAATGELAPEAVEDSQQVDTTEPAATTKDSLSVAAEEATDEAPAIAEAFVVESIDEDPEADQEIPDEPSSTADPHALPEATSAPEEDRDLYVVFGASMPVPEIAGPTLENAQQQCISLAFDSGCDLTLYRLVPVGQTRTSVTFVSQ